jgi:hypothetical protein
MIRFRGGRWALLATLSTVAGMTVTACGGSDNGGTSTGLDSGTDTGLPGDDAAMVDEGGIVTPMTDSGVGPKIDSSVGPKVDSGIGPVVDARADSAADATVGPSAHFASATVDFGNGDCGGTAVGKPFQISNSGSAPLTVNAVSTGAAFSVTPSTLMIAAGASGTLAVSASVPAGSTAATPLAGSLKLTTNDIGNASVTVNLSVTPHGGTLAWASTSPSSADFGTATLNAADTAIPLTLTNTGNASLSLTLGTPSDPQFSLTPVTATLAASASQVLNAGFTPTKKTHSTATSTFTVTGPVCGTGITQLSLSGQGGVGNVTGYPTAAVDVGFGACGGAAPAAQTFALANAGGVPVHITGAAFTGTSGFTTNAHGLTIPANGSANVTVNAPAIPFPSAVPGTYAATLTLTTDIAGDSPHQINLTEEAQGAILAFDTSPTPGFGNFGAVPVGTSSTQNFNVVNNGNAPSTVTLTTQAPFSVASASFGLDGSGSGTQANTASFAPSTYSGATATLALAGTNLCQPVPTPINFTGNGENGGVAISAQSLTFAANCGATASPSTFTIANPGNQPMTWSAALLGGVNSRYTFAPTGGTINPTDAPTTVTVTPNPIPQFPANPSPSAFADTLQITTTVTNDSPHSVALSETPLGDILNIQPQALAFGPVPVNSTSPPQSFVLVNAANPGSDPANVTLVSTNPTQFPIASTSATAAAGATSDPISMTFVPGTLPVADSTAVSLTTTDVLCAPLPLPALSANGTGTLAQVVINVTQLAFGNVNCGAQASPQQIILTNTGNQDYTVTKIALGNAAPNYTFAMVPANGVSKASNGNQVVITVTPNAIPANVANPAQSGPVFSDVITITTNAQNDLPHAIPLFEQAQGAVIDNNLASTNWSFGTVNYGSTGTFNVAIHNAGNAPVQIALSGLAQSLFGLASNPTVEGASPGSTSITGVFTPNAPSGSWADQGTLAVTPTQGNVFCEPLPASWANPVSFSGSASNNPTTTVSGSLVFPAVSCGAAVPGSQQITISNSSSSAQSFSATFDYGTYYQFVGASTGSVPPGGTATVTVQPLASVTAPGPNTAPGSSQFDDRVRLTVGSSNYYVPVALTLNGSVLKYEFNNPPFYGNSNGGSQIYLTNSGNVPATVSASFVGSANPGWSTSPASQIIPPGNGNDIINILFGGGQNDIFVLLYNGPVSCSSPEDTGTLTWVAANQCQPLPPAATFGCSN